MFRVLILVLLLATLDEYECPASTMEIHARALPLSIG